MYLICIYFYEAAAFTERLSLNINDCNMCKKKFILDAFRVE